jgi:hypothetical protein
MFNKHLRMNEDYENAGGWVQDLYKLYIFCNQFTRYCADSLSTPTDWGQCNRGGAENAHQNMNIYVCGTRESWGGYRAIMCDYEGYCISESSGSGDQADNTHCNTKPVITTACDTSIDDKYVFFFLPTSDPPFDPNDRWYEKFKIKTRGDTYFKQEWERKYHWWGGRDDNKDEFKIQDRVTADAQAPSFQLTDGPDTGREEG